jgi:hypothetical protein
VQKNVPTGTENNRAGDEPLTPRQLSLYIETERETKMNAKVLLISAREQDSEAVARWRKQD